MKFFYYLANFCYYVFFIFSANQKIPYSKIELFLNYLKLQFKYLFFVVLLKRKILKERLFNFQISLLDYSSFICMFEEIFIRRIYYFKAMTKSPLIYDCGSHIGIALIFFKMLYPKSRIFAFEPDKSAFSLLELNVNSNKLSDVLLFRQILSNKEGLVKFYFNPENLSSASKSIISERNSKSIVFERLPSVKLSAYIKGKIYFLKMDIEGAEGLVMSELSKKHKLSFVREAVVEFHHHIDSWKDDFSDFLNIFEKNGFGYQIRSTPKMPFTKKQFQDILIYAYKK